MKSNSNGGESAPIIDRTNRFTLMEKTKIVRRSTKMDRENYLAS